MADGVGEMLIAVPGFVAGITAGLIAGGLAAKFGAPNMVAGFVGIGIFVVTLVGVNIWNVRRCWRPPRSS